MNDVPKKNVSLEVVSLLASFQGTFFGIRDEAVLAELHPGLSKDEKRDALDCAAFYRPIVESAREIIHDYVLPPSNRVGDVAVVDEKSLNTEKFIFDFMTKYPRAQPELLRTIALKIYYWKVLR